MELTKTRIGTQTTETLLQARKWIAEELKERKSKEAPSTPEDPNKPADDSAPALHKQIEYLEGGVRELEELDLN